MANKQLTATVHIKTNNAVRSLDAILKKINEINRAIGVNNANLSNMTNSANNTAKAVGNVANQARQTGNIFNRLSNIIGTVRAKISTVKGNFNTLIPTIKNVVRQHFSWSNILSRVRDVYNRIRTVGQNIGSRIKNWFTNQQMVNSATRQTNSLLGSVWQKLKGIAATYLGIMGMRGLVNTADIITSAENKLNYINGHDVQATQQTMDKMYASAQKVRMAYTDMMSNVSKSMTLAGDAFQGNIDNAIRFQEIMAEAYAVGGASAQEMSSSMYQMIQALGAGILAGDELRSVREGAPLAYKAIEKFAQGVYNTEESLKDLASQGKITSDMVVAAVMNAGDELDSAFAQTSQTFAQTWEQIKNVAKKAFEPVARMMRDTLNNALDNGLIDKFENSFVGVSKAFQITFKVIANGINWIAENWGWLKNILITGLIALAGYFIITKTIAVLSAIASAVAWMMMHPILAGIIIALIGLIYIFLMWKDTAISTCEAIFYALLIIGVAIAIVGLLMGNWVVIVIGLVIALLGVILYFFGEVCYWAAWCAAWNTNIAFAVVNFIMACLFSLVTIIYNIVAVIVNTIGAAVMFIATLIQWVIAFIVNLVMGCGKAIGAIAQNVGSGIVNISMGLWSTIQALCKNISIAFQNAWNGALSAFWNFIAQCLDGLASLATPLNQIAELFGKGGISISGLSGGARSKANSYQQQDYVSISAAWQDGMNTKDYTDIGDAWSEGWNTMEYANMNDMIASGASVMDFASLSDAWGAGMGLLDYVDPKAWGSSAMDWGNGVKDSINSWGSNLADNVSEKLSLDSIGEKLGLDFSNLNKESLFPNYNLGGGYDPSGVLDDISDALGGGGGGKGGGIGGDTSKIADAMELTEEDLEALRKIAETEWKKEFTTAEIHVDMSNYNTINGDSDLDGIVTKLTDKLYEELSAVADGVYV